jgi:hypothetical protein
MKTAFTKRWGRARRRALAIVLAGVVLIAGGCSIRERICSLGHYPVKAVGNKTGRTCVPAGQDPPAGYVRYPDDKMPQYVDDTWDQYWRTVVVDKNGDVVDE